MAFCTVVNCMDGRVQLPVIKYLMDHLGVDYVDSITDPGPIRILSEEKKGAAFASIINRIKISTEKHGSRVIAVAGHHDCAGNPMPEKVQKEQTLKAIQHLKELFPGLKFIGLWVDEEWKVRPL